MNKICSIVLALLIMSITIPARLHSTSSLPEKPNIIIMLVDDLGWMDVGYNGNKYYETPNIDELASEGMIFNNAYAASPVCSPTRASIMTGLYPSRIGIIRAECHSQEVNLVKKNIQVQESDLMINQTVTRLALEYVTLAEILKDQGYVTAHIGKWHLGRKPFTPENQGFDHVFPNRPELPGPPGGYLLTESRINFTSASSNETITEALFDESINFIKDNKRQRFFLNLCPFSVHGPYSAKSADLDYFQSKKGNDQTLNPVMAAMIKNLDQCIGKITRFLKEEDLFKNTLILFCSDNGGISRVKGESSYIGLAKNYADGKAVTINAPLRGQKGTIYEGGIKIPMIMTLPDLINKGTSTNQVVSTVDILPTISDILHIRKTVNLDGKSILKVLKNPEDIQSNQYFCHYPTITRLPGGKTPATVLRINNYKLIRWYYKNLDRTHYYELFDLSNDISESNNLAATNPTVVKKMIKQMDSLIKESDSLIPQLVTK